MPGKHQRRSHVGEEEGVLSLPSNLWPGPHIHDLSELDSAKHLETTTGSSIELESEGRSIWLLDLWPGSRIEIASVFNCCLLPRDYLDPIRSGRQSLAPERA